MVVDYSDLDTKDKAIYRRRNNAYNKREGIRVGDWIKHKNGKFDRVTYIWRDENDVVFQIQTGGNKYGRYYMGDGYMSYSGGLNTGYEVPKTKFRKLNYLRDGMVWFFRHNHHIGGNGIETIMRFRVFEVV
jgi:hypothetical protein